MEFGNDLKLLSELLNPKQDNSDDEDYTTTSQINPSNTYKSPSDIGSKKKAKDNKEEKDDEKVVKSTEKKIEEDDYDFETSSACNYKNDWKKTPTFDVSYRQQVSTSDVFLQMGGKNPSTASCENMILKVHLPGESRHNIDLKVLKESLEIESPSFYLNIPLPHPVDPQLGNAQYDPNTEHLIITLVMDREFDYVNF